MGKGDNHETLTLGGPDSGVVGLAGVLERVQTDFSGARPDGYVIPVAEHSAAIKEAVYREVLDFARTPNPTIEERNAYATVLEHLQHLPMSSGDVRALDADLYEITLGLLRSDTVSDHAKKAYVLASSLLGIDNKQSGLSLGSKIERLLGDYRQNTDPNTQAAIRSYANHILPADKQRSFVQLAEQEVSHGPLSAREKRLAATTLVATVVITGLVALPAAAQDRGGSSTGPGQEVSISAPTTPGNEQQTTPAVVVKVDANQVKTPESATITAQTSAEPPSQATVKVSPSTADVTVPQDAKPIIAQTTQEAAGIATVSVSPDTSPTSANKQSAPQAIAVQTQPTAPAAPEAVAVAPSTAESSTPVDSQNAPTITAEAPDTSVTPKSDETVQAAIARVAEGNQTSNLVYMIRQAYGGVGIHQEAPNAKLATTVDTFTSDTQAKILAAGHAEAKYTNNAIIALAYLDAVANDPTILDPNRAVAKDAQTAIAAFASTGEPYHDKLLAQEVAAAKQNLASDASGKFAGISEADQNTIAQLAGYASLAAKTDAEQDAAIQKIKDDEAAAAKAAADAAAKAAVEQQQTGYSDAANQAAEAKGQEIDKQITDLINGMDKLSDSKKAFMIQMAQGLEALQGQDLPVNINVMFAQSIMESGYGQSGLGQRNNLFGMKAGSSWTGDTVVLPTKEWDGDKYITVDAKWRVYDSYADSMKDYAFNFIGGMSRYQGATAVKGDQSQYLDAILAAGYATSPTYKKNILALIDSVKINDITSLIASRQPAMQAERDRVRAAEEQAAAAQKAAEEAQKAAEAAAAMPNGLEIKQALLAEAPNGETGHLRDDELEVLGGVWGDLKLYPAAADKFREMSAAFEAQFGRPIELNNTYRDLAGQKAARAKYGSGAAEVGTSNHGLGLAFDLGIGSAERTEGTAEHNWLLEHGKDFGWINPDWAQDYNAKNGHHEPWHWEFSGSAGQY